MEFDGIMAATRHDLVRYATAVAGNGFSMLSDAELLLREGRNARACALAALAIEEFGKAIGVLTLSLIPDHLRSHVPLGKLLQWHAMKQVAGLMLALVQPSLAPGIAASVSDIPPDQLLKIVTALNTQAEDAGRMKERGLYADMGADGTIWQPHQITETEAANGTGRAREVAASAAAIFKDDDALERLANPPAEQLAMLAAVFEWYFAETSTGGGTEAAIARIGRVIAGQPVPEPPAD
jgi:AbiV family abortive infection protein